LTFGKYLLVCEYSALQHSDISGKIYGFFSPALGICWRRFDIGARDDIGCLPPTQMQLYRHDFGTVIAIGIESEDRDEIERQYFSCWNHQATGGELHWLTETFAYVWTTPNNLRHYLIQSSLCKLLNIDCGKAKGKKRGLMPEALKLAQERMDNIIPLEFVKDDEPDEKEAYVLGDIDFFKPDLQYLR